MVSPEQKRRAVENAYPGIKWALRVAAMSDAQVHTIYTRLLSEKKI
jgi:hypothetical protein